MNSTAELLIENRYQGNREIKDEVLELVRDYYHFSDEIRTEFFYIVQDIVRLYT